MSFNLCDSCSGVCCKQSDNRPFAVMLVDGDNAEDYQTIEADDGIDDDVKVKAIPYRDGKCIYLSDENRCTIYEKRPVLCREFYCFTNYDPEKRLSFFLEDNPEVVELIELNKDKLNR